MNLGQAESEHAGRTRSDKRTRRRRHCKNGHRFTTREIPERTLKEQNAEPPVSPEVATAKFQQILQIIAAK